MSSCFSSNPNVCDIENCIVMYVPELKYICLNQWCKVLFGELWKSFIFWNGLRYSCLNASVVNGVI